jgi:hypothetical protein
VSREGCLAEYESTGDVQPSVVVRSREKPEGFTEFKGWTEIEELME